MDTESKNEKGFDALLDKMNNINHDNYFSLMYEIGKVLDVLEKADIVYIEAMLIEATKMRYQDDIKAEVVLVKFGLLDGYYQYKCNLLCEGHSDMSPTRKCHIKFLKESNYMRDYNGKYKSYEEAEEAKKVDSVIDTLKKAEKRYIREVANTLYSNRHDIYNCISEHEDSFIIQFKVGDELKKIPKLPHVKENKHKSSSQSQGEEPNDSVEPDGTDTSKTESRRTNTWRDIFLKNKFFKILQQYRININFFKISETNQKIKIINIDKINDIDNASGSNDLRHNIAGKLGIVLLFLVVVMFGSNLAIKFEVSWAKKTAENILPDEIKIINKNIQLSPGEDDYLKIETKPEQLEPEKLSYRSLDNDIVSPENLHSPHIIAGETLKNDAENTTIIMVHGDGYAQDIATVRVIERNTNGIQTGSVGNGVSVGSGDAE